jgi:hypothetical protein
MDNHVDWLYYIVILVVGLISFVGNLKKKKPQEQTLPPASPPSMEEILLPPVPQLQTRKRKNPPPTPKARRTSYTSPSQGMEEGRRMLDEETIAFGERKETTRAGELDLTDADVFRKAFIAAEILNRKY